MIQWPLALDLNNTEANIFSKVNIPLPSLCSEHITVHTGMVT
jgi:hypothetical protein